MSNNPLSLVLPIFIEPKKAFEEILKKGHIWFPLLVLSLVSAGMLYWYFQTVDFPWLLDQMIAAQPDMKADAKEVFLKMMTRPMMTWSTVIGALIGVPLMAAIGAAYLTISAKMIGSELRFEKWLAFSAWTMMPSLIGTLLMGVQIASSNGQVTPEGLDMLSVNYLIAHQDNLSSWGKFFNTLHLTYFWTIFVSFVGLRTWTDRSTRTCAIIAALPYVIIFGGWAAFLLAFAKN